VSITPNHIASFLTTHAETIESPSFTSGVIGQLQCNLPIVNMIAGSLLCLGWYMGFKVKKEYPEVNGKRGEPLSLFHGADICRMAKSNLELQLQH
jgi:hypothetical protein